jgi:hypothetical protein
MPVQHQLAAALGDDLRQRSGIAQALALIGAAAERRMMDQDDAEGTGIAELFQDGVEALANMR